MIFKKRTHISWPTWPHFFKQCLLLTVAMLGAVWLKKGFSYDSMQTLLEAALLFGFFSAVCYTLILTTEIQLFIARIGFFNIFLNAGLLYLVAKIIPMFEIDRFSTAFWGGMIINVMTWMMSAASIFAPAVIKKDSSGVKQARAKVIRTRAIAPTDQDQQS